LAANRSILLEGRHTAQLIPGLCIISILGKQERL
jgi:hypothetical protein